MNELHFGGVFHVVLDNGIMHKVLHALRPINIVGIFVGVTSANICTHMKICAHIKPYLSEHGITKMFRINVFSAYPGCPDDSSIVPGTT